MTDPIILVATWRDGLFVIAGETCQQELAGQSVRGLTSDGGRGALAIVDRHSLCRRHHNGTWSTITEHKAELACCMAAGNIIYVGTDDAQVLRISTEGQISQLDEFTSVAGRDTWYAGSAIVNGQVVGPPLGVRSMAASSDGNAIFANVHVGGIPRSKDGGVTWEPTIDVDYDVHEVRMHPKYPEIVIAAAAVGLCISRDGGATWSIEKEGLHGTHCTAVAFSNNDILLAASQEHFSPRGAVYSCPIECNSPFAPVEAGLPRWTDGIVDTGCIAANDLALAVADKGGNIFARTPPEHAWVCRANSIPAPSSLLIV